MKRIPALMVASISLISVLNAQEQLAQPISSPEGTLYCTETYGQDNCIWTNWYFVDVNGITHAFPYATTVWHGLLYPESPVPRMKGTYTTINETSSDGLYTLVARGPEGNLTAMKIAYPKMQVLNVTYAPPGPGSTVSYKENTSAGVTTTIDKSFSYALNLAVTLGVGGDTLGADYTHTSTTNKEESITKNKYYDITTKNDNNFINHDYDAFIVWLNPEVRLAETSSNSANWFTVVNAEDPYIPRIAGVPQMDHITLLAGWLNGNLNWPDDNDMKERLKRAWDKSMPNPGLTISDFAAILALDPFAQQIDPVSGNKLPQRTQKQIYDETMISGSNHRYTLLRNVNYTPAMQSISGNIGTITSNSLTNSHTNELKLSWGFKSPFIDGGASWTWTNRASVKSSSGAGNEASYTIVTPNGAQSLPFASSVSIYQDNLYGSFMFVFPGSGF